MPSKALIFAVGASVAASVAYGQESFTPLAQKRFEYTNLVR